MESLDDYKDEPYNHNAFDWISQDGTRTNIQELDDRYLINIFKIITKSISMAKEDIRIYGDAVTVLDGENEMIFALALSDTMESLDEFNTQIRFIGHEMYKRGLLINKFDKYELLDRNT